MLVAGRRAAAAWPRPHTALSLVRQYTSRRRAPDAAVEDAVVLSDQRAASEVRVSAQMREVLVDAYAQLERDNAALSRHHRPAQPFRMRPYSGALIAEDPSGDALQESVVIQNHFSRERVRVMEDRATPASIRMHMQQAGFFNPNIVAVPLTGQMTPFLPTEVVQTVANMYRSLAASGRQDAAAQHNLSMTHAPVEPISAPPALPAGEAMDVSGIIKKRRKKMKKHKYRKRLKKTRALRKSLKKI